MDVFTQFDDRLERAWNASFAQDCHRWPFYTYRWHRTWHRIFGHGQRLMIYADRVLIPLALHGTTARFTGGEEIADYLDAVGDDREKFNAWEATLPLLKTQGVTDISLRNIPEGSPTLDYFGNQKVPEDTTPIIRLPVEFDAYAAGLDRKNRHELRRKLRKFETEHPDISMTEGTDVKLLISLMKRDPEKTVFLTESMQLFFRLLPEAADLRQFTLVLGGKPAATVACFAHAKSLLVYNSGYDASVTGSGWYIKVKVIEWAIRNGWESVNFLQGNERYKYELGAVDYPVYCVEKAI